jgi:hypothetical protein
MEKTGFRKNDGIDSLVSIPFPDFSANTKTDRSNVENGTGRDIFFHPFSTLLTLYSAIQDLFSSERNGGSSHIIFFLVRFNWEQNIKMMPPG